MRRLGLVLLMMWAACGGHGKPAPEVVTVWPEDALAALPVDTRAVISVDVEKAQASPTLVSLVRDSARFSVPNGDRMERECGLKADKLIRRVMLGASALGDRSDVFVVVQLSVTRALIDACWAKLGFAVAMVGQTVRYESPGATAAVFWVKDDMVVTTAATTIDPERLKADRGIARPDLHGLLRRVDQKGIVWIASSGLGEEQLDGTLVPDTWFASLSGVTDLTVALTGVYDSPEAATAVDNRIGTQVRALGLLSAAMRKLDLERHGREMTLSATWTPEELNEMKTTLGSFVEQMF